MPRNKTAPPLVRRIAGACLAGALAAGVVIGATQSPTSPRLAGEAPAPASALSLWYRAPASDHPLLPMDASRESRQAATAEWVRALPIGNGRLGAMVFGGVEHERLQLNEDTIWAGETRDRLNPDGPATVPEIRRLLFEGKPVEAEALADKAMIAIPRRMPPYQPLGDLTIDFTHAGAPAEYVRVLALN